MSIGWEFPSTNGGIAIGFNDGAINAFKGNKVSSVVREIVQNSLDASKNKNNRSEPVKICFKLAEVEKSKFEGFDGIIPNLKKCKEIVNKKTQNLHGAEDYYERALKAISESKKVKILCIHDYNTTGLTGRTDDDKGPWVALIRFNGLSQKTGKGARGSFGHGAAAPFPFTKIRSVFYYTKVVNEDGQIEERFQGKSRLQSHRCPYNSHDELTQGVGFYGHKGRSDRALINCEVPNWAKDLRKVITQDTGTSIYIPFTNFEDEDSDFNQTRITVIANYFRAIKEGALEITIDDTLIDKNNVVETYIHCKSLIKDDCKLKNEQHIRDCFTSIETIINPDHSGKEAVKEFGKFEWYLRVNDALVKGVGVGRKHMLITKKPERLLKFPNLKNFDMYVDVTDKEGSDVLLQLENPEHDAFQFDRLDEGPEKENIIKKYSNFVISIRNIIKKYAQLEAVSESFDLKLADIFGQPPRDGSSGSKPHYERGKKLIVGTEVYVGPEEDDDDEDEDLTYDDEEEEEEDVIGKYKAENLRIKHIEGKDNLASLYFDSSVSGDCHLSVHMIGENISIPVEFIYEGELTKEVPIFLIKGERKNLEVAFQQEVKNFTLQATISKVRPPK